MVVVVVDHIWRTHPGQKANPVKKFDAPLPSSTPQIETFQIKIWPLKKLDKYVLESRSNFLCSVLTLTNPNAKFGEKVESWSRRNSLEVPNSRQN